MASYTKKSLLEKYDLQIDQLDYKFIGDLKDVKTLERILTVLRSGQEGIYPDLIKFCENRLQVLAPKSRLLHPAKKIKKFSELSENERRDIESQLEGWWNRTEEEEKIKDSSIHINRDIPPVRGNSIKIETSKKKETTSPCRKVETKRSKLRSYSEWDKFDVEEELKKLDESEKNDIPKPPSDDKKKLHNDSELQPLVCVSDLSEKERQYIADREKNKGNEAFKAHDYGEAVFYYTRSISAYKSVVALNNRAQAHIELNNYLAAIEDCNKILLMDPNNLKALYRRGLALKRNEMYDLAELDFRTLLELDAENKPAKEQLKQIKKLRLTKPENKKVVIEEIKSDEIETTEIEKDENVKGTRMKIEEVSTTENTEKLTNLNYSSSDEDDNIAHLPIKVKQMLQVNKTSNKQKYRTDKLIGEDEIEKTPIRETNRNVQKLKIIEECERGKVNKNASNTNRDKRKFEDNVVRIAIEDTISNKENPKQHNKCMNKNKQLNCINSVDKEVVLKTVEKNATNYIVEDGKPPEYLKENIPNKKNSTNSIKYLTKTETSSTDFNYNSNIKNNEKNETHIISKEDNTRKSNQKIIKTNDNMISNGEEKIKQYPDSTKVKSIVLEGPVSNQHKLRKVDECEMNNKKFSVMNLNGEIINDNKLCKLENLKKSFNESNENNLKADKYCNVNFSECKVFNHEDTTNYKEDNAKIFERELSSKKVESINEVIITTESNEEINVNKTGYLVANNWQKDRNISVFNCSGKHECNGSIFDSGQEIHFLKNEESGGLDSTISNTKTVNGIQTHKKEHKMHFDEETKIYEDTPNYGVNIFTVQDTGNKNKLNKIIDNDVGPQVLPYENLERTDNYKINNSESFKPLEDELKKDECTYNNSEKYHDSETSKTHPKNVYEELEDEFIDVENDDPLQQTIIQMSKEQTEEYEMNLTNSRYKNIKEDTKFVEHPRSSFNSSKLFEERREDNVCYSNYTKEGNVDYNENEELNERDIEVFIKDAQPLKSAVLENDEQYEKVSPYEFLCTWCLNDDRDVKTGALNLLKMKPEELPQIISNKLEASMLAGILKAISAVCKMGKSAEGEKYLYYLTQVPRINIVAMFLTDDETKSIHDLFSKLECEHGLHMKYVKMILQA